MNTGILVSGFPPEFNLIVKAALIFVVLVIQSPLATRIVPARRPVREAGK
jgi:simple sugar transport system permease protein